VGGHTALQLLNTGYIVRGSVRDVKKGDKVRATLARNGADVSRLEFVALDLKSDAGWADAMRDVRYLHHIASPLMFVMPKDSMELVRPAVEGTTRALENAFALGVERVVMTASISAMMYGHGKARTKPITADDWSNLDSPDINAYVESKTLAEKAAWSIADKHGRRKDLVAVNPGPIFGPLLDEDPGTSANMIVRMLGGKVPAVPEIQMIIADVRDVAGLHLAAMTNPAAGGRRFPLGDRSYSLMEIVRMVGQTIPARAGKLPKFELPDWVTRIVGRIDGEVRGSLCELGYARTTESLEAKALLGRTLVPAEETIAVTARTIMEQKLV
jgi:nucleoside-diphosphate-sugar epimerase